MKPPPTAAVVLFLLGALAGGCSIFFEPALEDLFDVNDPFKEGFNWMYLVWISGFVLCALLIWRAAILWRRIK